MDTLSDKIEQFEPHLVYHGDVGMLQVIFLDRAVDVVKVENGFDILENANPTSENEPIVGFNLWGVWNVLEKYGYGKPRITLGRLLNIFEERTFLPHGVTVFGKYRREVLAAAQKYPLVWQIPR
ncbi:MAG: hypothetical protein M0P64_04190 [Candidatus Pacebacteria bacterium]|jgi:hypothetical protein|nr:hypothetical protein [Candidatus Paceibacterota bacterium]